MRARLVRIPTLVYSACSPLFRPVRCCSSPPPPPNPNPRLGEEGTEAATTGGGGMSAKKGLSSTLKNLKFMQRAAVAQKLEVKADADVEMEAEVVLAPAANGGGVGSSVQVARKCVVVMEGNPHPGAIKGRMSFQNFNPSIDKLNDEANGRPTQSASPSNSHQDSENTNRTDDVSASRFRDFNIDSSESISLNELKRKEPELEMETPPSRKLPKTTGQNVDGQPSSQNGNVFGQRTKSNNRGKGKGKGKLDYNLLRQQKSK